MRVLIVAGSQHPRESARQGRVTQQDEVAHSDWDLVVGADGGAARALALGLAPDIVVGDMDSLPSTARRTLEKQGSQFLIHPRAKDETDLELALEYATNQGAQEIVILGALGGRLDHTLANVLLLTTLPSRGVTVRIVDDDQVVSAVWSGQTLTLQGKKGDLVSLLPLAGDVKGITTTGLAWPMTDDRLLFGYTRGVSNEMTGSEVSVRVTDGLLLVVHDSAQDSQA